MADAIIARGNIIVTANDIENLYFTSEVKSLLTLDYINAFLKSDEKMRVVIDNYLLIIKLSEKSKYTSKDIYKNSVVAYNLRISNPYLLIFNWSKCTQIGQDYYNRNHNYDLSVLEYCKRNNYLRENFLIQRPYYDVDFNIKIDDNGLLQINYGNEHYSLEAINAEEQLYELKKEYKILNDRVKILEQNFDPLFLSIISDKMLSQDNKISDLERELDRRHRRDRSRSREKSSSRYYKREEGELYR